MPTSPYRGTTPDLIALARQHRAEPTPAEAALWRAIRRQQVAGARFRRQHPLGPFILDFCCTEARLVVEVDGSVHDDQVEYDAVRTAHLESFGYRVLRFRNNEVLHDLSSVLERIADALAMPEPRASSPPSPRASGGRGSGG